MDIASIKLLGIAGLAEDVGVLGLQLLLHVVDGVPRTELREAPGSSATPPTAIPPAPSSGFPIFLEVLGSWPGFLLQPLGLPGFWDFSFKLAAGTVR